MSDRLTPEAVEPRLRGRFGRPYRYVETCPSTQRLVRPSDPEGTLAVAEEQTEGRGRLGRRWLAPRGTSLLCSLLLRPRVPPARLPELSLVAGAACADAIGSVAALATTIKFPNDVLVRGQKVAGILAEAKGGHVVLGIGINVNVPHGELPADVATPATSILAETGRRLDRADLLVVLLERLEERYDAWAEAAD